MSSNSGPGSSVHALTDGSTSSSSSGSSTDRAVRPPCSRSAAPSRPALGRATTWPSAIWRVATPSPASEVPRRERSLARPAHAPARSTRPNRARGAPSTPERLRTGPTGTIRTRGQAPAHWSPHSDFGIAGPRTTSTTSLLTPPFDPFFRAPAWAGRAESPMTAAEAGPDGSGMPVPGDRRGQPKEIETFGPNPQRSRGVRIGGSERSSACVPALETAS